VAGAGLWVAQEAGELRTQAMMPTDAQVTRRPAIHSRSRGRRGSAVRISVLPEVIDLGRSALAGAGLWVAQEACELRELLTLRPPAQVTGRPAIHSRSRVHREARSGSLPNS
jgi:hypothetical protein